MYFISFLKKIFFQETNEEITEEKETLKNNNQKNIISILDKEFDYSFLFKNILAIRIILIIAFFFFVYFFIKVMTKKEKVFENQTLSLNQRLYKKLDLRSIKSQQLINKNNIRVSKKININLKLEHSNYVHLEIESNHKNRWKVPKEILNKNYFNTLDEKKSEKKKVEFEIEYGQQNDDFFFNLYFESKRNKNIFYSFTTENNFLYSKTYINFESILSSDDIFGFGERVHSFKLTEGIYTIWPTNQKPFYDEGKGGQNLYGHQPIGLHKTKYKDLWLGFVFFNSNAQDIQISKNNKNNTILSHKTIGGIIDYYIIVNNSPENVIKDINFLIGPPTLPPYWGLGYHHGGDMFKTVDEFKKIYELYKTKKIPIDSMWIKEIVLNREYKNYEEEDYLSDDNFAYFIREKLHYNDHTNLVITRDCDISYNDRQYKKYFKIADEYNILVKSGFTENNLISQYEKGRAMTPDFLDPEINILWNEILFDIYNTEANFDGICLENEPIPLKYSDTCQGEILSSSYACNMLKEFQLSYLPGYKNEINILSSGGLSLSALTFNNMIFNNKPLINIYQSKHSFNYLKSIKKRPFIMSQSNSFGSGKYSFHWFGNYKSFNDYLRYSVSSIFTYNIFGIPFTGADICGTHKTADPNLCLRWYNIGAFYPFMRNNFHLTHMEKDKYPWSFGPEIENIIKRNIKMRYSLLRYFYSQLFLISINEKGGFFKPVMFEYPNEIESYIDDIENRIMIGEAFLLCPFYDNDENDKEFFFPNDNWNKYPKGENIINYNDEKRKIKLSGKKEELHLFLRGGYIIPMQDTLDKYISNTYYLRLKKLNLIINPDSYGYSKGNIFFDNDDIDTLENNTYISVNLEFKGKILKIKVNFNNIKYIYKDDILNTIEIWRINEIYEEKIINKGKIDLIMKIKNEIKKTNGVIDKEKNKMKIIFDEEVSLFDINEIDINC